MEQHFHFIKFYFINVYLLNRVLNSCFGNIENYCVLFMLRKYCEYTHKCPLKAILREKFLKGIKGWRES